MTWIVDLHIARRIRSLCERLCEQTREAECDYNSYVPGLASLVFLLLTTKIFRFRNGANNIRTGAVKLQG